VSLIPASHQEWQTCRQLVRLKRAKGRDLRMDRSRKTKDGTFLTAMVERNILRVVKAADDPFDAEYVLTRAGEHIAEYGECDMDMALGKFNDPVRSRTTR